MKSIETYIPEFSEKGHAIGYDAETGDQVFVSASMVNRHVIEPGIAVRFLVVPNNHDASDRTPWRAVGISASNKTAPPEGETEMATISEELEPFTQEDVRNYVIETGTVWTAADLYDEFECQNAMERKRVCNALRAGHDAGQLACAAIRGASGQEKASRLFYASDVTILCSALIEYRAAS